MTPEEWKPIGIKELEDEALKAVKNTTNELVIAGPGAGKTELLAQKACYLLQTNTCPYPYKILALTFKVDAAKNLKQRINQRVNDEKCNRFISETYEAFFVRLINQFQGGLPIEWNLFSELNIKNFEARKNEERAYLNGCEDERCSLSYLESINSNTLENDYLLNKPINEYNNDDIHDYISIKVWQNLLRTNRITFKMVPRLAEFILDKNPYIVKCLQQTYKHIFIDEFQDTTSIQYDIIKKLFLTDKNFITAVGDNNQKIMSWAGAMDGVFECFKFDFKSETFFLKNNYRSIPSLVEIQKNLTQLFSIQSEYISALEISDDIQNPCTLYLCDNEIKEAKVISKLVKELLNECPPNEICLLIRSNFDQISKIIIDTLQNDGIKVRNENMLQDLLKEPAIQLICNIIRISFSYEYKDDYISLKSYFLRNLNLRDFEKNTQKIIQIIKSQTLDFESLFDEIVQYLNPDLLSKSYSQYRKSKFLMNKINDFLEYIKPKFNNIPLLEIINDLVGDSYVPIMSIHKSKGLEFENVILIGLEDNAFWNYNENQTEENCTFFVAFSRAKKRVFFTMSKLRHDKWGRQVNLSLANITPIIDILKQSNMKILNDQTYLSQ